MPVTMITAAIIGAILLVLSFRITAIRRSAGISLGDGGNPDLLARIRAQANCVEYAPLALILLLLAEQQFGPSPVVIALAALLVVGRIAHPIGMAMPAPNVPRVVGMLGTWLSILFLIPLLLAGAMGAVAPG